MQSILNEQNEVPFVLINPTNRDFILVYSQSTEVAKSYYPDLPAITYITDVPYQKHSVRRVGQRVVVCLPGNLRYRCGLRIEDNGVGWSILFNREKIEDAERISNEAAELLKGYRKS